MRDGENQTLNMSLSRKCFSADHLPSRPAALLGTVALGILRNAGHGKSANKNRIAKLKRIADTLSMEVWECYSFFLQIFYKTYLY